MFTRRGFTLVEVLLVIVIIGILAAIVLPRLMFGKKDAQITACDANVAALNAQIELYHAKEGTWADDDNPTDFQQALIDKDYLVDKAVCPFATAYVTNTKHRVIKHTH